MQAAANLIAALAPAAKRAGGVESALDGQQQGADPMAGDPFAAILAAAMAITQAQAAQDAPLAAAGDAAAPAPAQAAPFDLALVTTPAAAAPVLPTTVLPAAGAIDVDAGADTVASDAAADQALAAQLAAAGAAKAAVADAKASSAVVEAPAPSPAADTPPPPLQDAAPTPLPAAPASTPNDAAPAAAVQAAAAAPTPRPTAAAERPQAQQARADVKSVRNDGRARASAAETAAPTIQKTSLGGVQDIAVEAASDGDEELSLADSLAGDAPASSSDAKPDQPQAPFLTTELRAQAGAIQSEIRAAAHTVAHLAAHIVDKVSSKATRFDVELQPAGLGKVDVRIEIGARGELSAALSFDNPQSAAELRGRAHELQRALEQAGFDLSKGGLSFDLSGQNNGRDLWAQQQQSDARPAWRGAAFTDLSGAADLPPVLRRSAAAGGVDVTV